MVGAGKTNRDLTALVGRLEVLRPLLAGLSGGGPTRLDQIENAFALSPFERDALLLCAGVEIDAETAQAVALAGGQDGRAAPTFALLLAAFPGAHWSAAAPEGPLRRWRLVELGVGPITQAPLAADERVLHFLLGQRGFDERLAALLTPVKPTPLAASHAALADQIAAQWLSAEPSEARAPLLQVNGRSADALPVLAEAAARLGFGAMTTTLERLPPGGAELETFARLWAREAALSGQGVLIVETDEVGADGESRRRALANLVDRLSGPVAIVAREPQRFLRRSPASFEVGPPTTAEQFVQWRNTLGGSGPGGDELHALVGQFALSTAEIAVIAAEANTATSPPSLWDLCRRHSRGALEGLAERVETTYGWDDLVLPHAQKKTLKAIAAQMRARTTVYDEWGFGAASRRGQGISALFHGPSGVGKTMAAEVLARELRLDLYHIDLSRVVSKYIGETEANLRRVFDAAEDNGAILLFDEADSLFGARSEVKDSHDRYANIEVSYLLQRMEAYRGLAILTTNMRSALDPAFLRRLRFAIAFPFPDVAERAEIWRRVFPRKARTAGLDADRLARLRVAGGNIRNIALNAAFLAADEHEPVQMRHVREAAEAEYAKLERRLTQTEADAWA
jgi:hypothetical protein